jgi:hypothetical protein
MATFYIFAREVGPYRVGDAAAKLGDPTPEGAPKKFHWLDPQRFAMLVKSRALVQPEPKEDPPAKAPKAKEAANG